MRLGRVGWAVVIVGAVALAYVLGQPAPQIDGRVYGPDVTIPAALLGLGAVIVGLAGPKPLDSRLARVGVGLLALGAFAIAAMKTIESGTNPMAGLMPLAVALVGFVSGGVAIAIALLRRGQIARP